jgi:uncharacterized NAD-dependent epimerase/dehydratase family protein
MVDLREPVAIYVPGAFGKDAGKMANGILRYGKAPIVAIIDPSCAGKTVGEVLGAWVPSERRSVPVVDSVASACSHGSRVLIIGIAVAGGRIPLEAYDDLDCAYSNGLSIVNGLHTDLASRYERLAPGQVIWDIRTEPPGLKAATDRVRHLGGRRVLLVGTDMGVGKMTTGLELYRAACEKGIDAAFIATGQTGITIVGTGVPLDAIRLDFAAGAIESEVMKHKEKSLIIVEGQGSLLHPGSSATLPLLRGAMPTHLVMCHRAGMLRLRRAPQIAVPNLLCLCKLYEDLASTVGVHVAARVVALNLNTVDLTEGGARSEIHETGSECELPCDDVVRFGAGKILEAVMASPLPSSSSM